MIVDALRAQCGPGWLRSGPADEHFEAAVVAAVKVSEAVHLVGEPITGGKVMRFRLWLDEPAPDLLLVDSVAFDIFGLVALNLFVSCRDVSHGALRYRMLTGSMAEAFIAELEFVGPHARQLTVENDGFSIGGVSFHA